LTLRLRRAIQDLSTAGYMLEEEAFNLLKIIENEDVIYELVKRAIEIADKTTPKPLYISKDMLEAIAKEKVLKEAEDVKVGFTRSFKPFAEECESDIEILFDPTLKIGSKGDAEDFTSYFKSRFIKISKILRERLDVRDAVTIGEALKSNGDSTVKFIAMISEKRERGGKIFLRVEDLEDTAVVMVSNSSSYELTQAVLFDQVVCIEAYKTKRDLFISKNIIFPDLPERKIQVRKDPLHILSISDVHFGSKTFRDDLFKRLIFWLNGKIGNSHQLERAGFVKYLVISGDLVDGVGVYPDQDKELLLPDVYKQYQLFSQYIEQIPEYIDVLIIPGNHDATRQALPQPAIPKEYAEPVYEARNVISIGNPATVRINGRVILLFHGTSLNDVISNAPKLNFNVPEKGMECLLKARHLAPIYGGGTSIAPEEEDYLVVEWPPDVFQVGHIHVEGNEFYRGTLMLSCATWQEQTEYQRKMGLNPTVGVGSLIELGSLRLSLLNFVENP